MNNQSSLSRLSRLYQPAQVLESTEYSAKLQAKFEAYVTKANRTILCEAINALQNSSGLADADQYKTYCDYCRSLPAAMGIN